MECEKCKEYIESTTDNFVCENSGKSFCQEFGFYYWWEGILTCDYCGHKNEYQDQSI